MSHDSAELAHADPQLGPAGKLVTIQQVQTTYGTAAAAKAAVHFRCADCKTEVFPVIPRRLVPNRLRSPSPHFKAVGSHRPGCTRLPVAVPSIGPTAKTMAARPQRARVPTEWRDAPPVGPRRMIGVAHPGSVAAAPSAVVRGARVSGPGTGMSIKSATDVRVFAEALISMGPGEASLTELTAYWNPGGTYETAFVGVGAGVVTEANPPERVYYGQIEEVHRGKSGYTLTLTHRHANGLRLRIWLQYALETASAPGPQLWADLVSGQVTKDMFVFALGEFRLQQSPGSSPNYYSMPVTDGHRVWITS